MKQVIKKSQHGAVLIISLVFMLLTAIIAVTATRTSIFEVRMASNEQLREEAFQQTQGVANAITTNTDNFVVAGDIGYKICKTGVTGCDTAVITLDSGITAVPSGVNLDYHVERQGPLFTTSAFRLSEDESASSSAYSMALFEVNVTYDGSSNALGKAEIAQGVAYRLAKGSQ